MRASHMASSFSGCGISQHVLVPETVKASGPGRRHLTASHGPEGTAFHGRTHVNVNDEQANRKQRATRMDEHGSIAEVAKAPRNPMWEPEDQTGEQQQDSTPEKSPEEQLLPGVEAIGRRNQFVFIANVMWDGAPEFLIGLRLVHLPAPHSIHQECGEYEDQSEPRMQLTRNRGAAKHGRQPEKPRRPE